MLRELLSEIRACRICAEHLAHEPRPILRASESARLSIVGQAPGRRVHESGIPWSDPSGDRLRDWLRIGKQTFYDEAKIAIVPMGFCYPGTKKGADLRPRPECATAWHEPLLAKLPNIELTLPIGAYAQARYLADRRKRTLTDTVAAWRDYGSDTVPLPHPSGRNNGWIKRNPWFETDLLPDLRFRIGALGIR